VARLAVGLVTVGSTTPRGVLVYTSRIVREWSERVARKEIGEFLEMGASTVMLCVEASKGWRADHGVLVDVADHLRSAGLRVGVYSLPSVEAWREPERLADRLVDAGIACRAERVAPDVEEQARSMGPQVRRFFVRLFDRVSERFGVTVTLYGKIPRVPLPARAGDGRFPWIEVVGKGDLGYQLYVTAEHDELVDARMDDARHHWGDDVMPYVGTYLGDARRLDADIERACMRGGEIYVPGVGVWQDVTTDAAERAVLKKWATRFAERDRDRRSEDDTQRLRPGG
jgi:hypothetical protein